MTPSSEAAGPNPRNCFSFFRPGYFGLFFTSSQSGSTGTFFLATPSGDFADIEIIIISYIYHYGMKIV
jgi:hypothetical protein